MSLETNKSPTATDAFDRQAIHEQYFIHLLYEMYSLLNCLQIPMAHIRFHCSKAEARFCQLLTALENEDRQHVVYDLQCLLILESPLVG